MSHSSMSSRSPGSRSPRLRRSRSRDLSRSRSRSPVGGAQSQSGPAPVKGSGDQAMTRSRRLKSKRITMLNLPYNMNVLRLKNLVKERLGFAGFVHLLDENGRSTGIGYMDFKSFEGAEDALERLPGMDIDGRRLKVREEKPGDRERLERAEAEAASGRSRVGRSDNGGSGGRGQLSPPRHHSSYYPGESAYDSRRSGGGGGSSQSLLDQLGIRGPISSTVFVSNLDRSVTWQKLKDVFRLAGRVLKADILGEPDGNKKLAGLVQFETPLEAAQAISMLNNQMLYDRPMRVRMDLPESERDSSRRRGGDRGGPSLPEGLGGLGAGLGEAAARSLQAIIGSGASRDRINSSSRDRGGGGSSSNSYAQSDTVFVSNLPYSYTWQELKQAFRSVGDVRHADIDLGPDNRSIGTGKVRFASALDARKAVAAMDGIRLDGRSVRVVLK